MVLTRHVSNSFPEMEAELMRKRWVATVLFVVLSSFVARGGRGAERLSLTWAPEQLSSVGESRIRGLGMIPGQPTTMFLSLGNQGLQVSDAPAETFDRVELLLLRGWQRLRYVENEEGSAEFKRLQADEIAARELAHGAIERVAVRGFDKRSVPARDLSPGQQAFLEFNVQIVEPGEYLLIAHLPESAHSERSNWSRGLPLLVSDPEDLPPATNSNLAFSRAVSIRWDDPSAALRIVEDAIQRYATSFQLRTLQGDLLIQLGRETEALETLRIAETLRYSGTDESIVLGLHEWLRSTIEGLEEKGVGN